MQSTTRRRRLAAALLAAGLGATACSGGDGDSGAADGTFTMYVNNPEKGLVPGDTTESEGAQILEPLFVGLVEYDIETSQAENLIAESIESPDSTNWTVKLEDGWTFHDGTPVTATSFVDAWNYTALGTNAQSGGGFFSNIAGYADLQCGETPEAEPDCEGQPPKAQTLTGLKVVDDSTFTVQLDAPFAQFPLTVGYTAFQPLPESFYDDPEAFGKKPIGNGPFKADTEFVQDEGITLSKFEDYAGEPAKAEGLEFRIFDNINTAFTELQDGSLDVVKDVPPDALTSIEEDFGDRFLERASAGFTYMGFPIYDARFADKRVRQAFSLAVDREAITEAVFNGTREPATDVIPPVIDGHRDDACTYCVFDAARAKTLLAEAGFDTSQPVPLYFNAGAGNDQWVQAVGNQLRENLGIEFTLEGDLEFAEYLPFLDAKSPKGPFRLGWGMDYPSPQNFLEPLFTRSAFPPGSNSIYYENPQFEALVQEGNSARSNEEAIAKYQAADDILLEDMPMMPMWFDRAQAAHSERVSGVQIDAFERIRTALVTLEE